MTEVCGMDGCRHFSWRTRGKECGREGRNHGTGFDNEVISSKSKTKLVAAQVEDVEEQRRSRGRRSHYKGNASFHCSHMQISHHGAQTRILLQLRLLSLLELSYAHLEINLAFRSLVEAVWGPAVSL